MEGITVLSETLLDNRIDIIQACGLVACMCIVILGLIAGYITHCASEKVAKGCIIVFTVISFAILIGMIILSALIPATTIAVVQEVVVADTVDIGTFLQEYDECSYNDGIWTVTKYLEE